MKHLSLRVDRRSEPRRLRGGIRLVPLLLLAGLASAIAPMPQEDELWYAYVDGDQRFGSQRVDQLELANGNLGYALTARILVNALASQRQEILVHASYEVTPELRVVSMRVETEQLSGSSLVTGSMEGDTWMLTVERVGVTSSRTSELDPARPVLFTVRVEDWLARLPATSERVEAQLIDEETGAVEAVVATRRHLDDPSSAGSAWHLAFDQDYKQRELILDAEGRLVSAKIGVPPQHLVRCTAAEAGELVYLSLDGRDALVLPVNRDIPRRSRLTRLVVTLTWNDLPFEAFALEDARQRLLERSESEGGRVARVEITDPVPTGDPVPFPLPGALLDEDASLVAFLGETETIKPRHPDILAAARTATADKRDAEEAVRALSTFVFEHVEGQLIVETLTGPEVLAGGRGKCSEFSNLFASLARAVGIPTRIVLGQRMVGNLWMGHMWCEAWVGRWVTVDSTEDEVDRSLFLLKFLHADSVEDVQPLRWALPASLTLSIDELGYRGSNLAARRTGVDGHVYTNVEYAVQLAAPAEAWTLVDRSPAEGGAVVELKVPEAEGLSIHFLAYPVHEEDTPERSLDVRLGLWENAFPEHEVLAHEPREVLGKPGHLSYHTGRRQGSTDEVHRIEVAWFRGEEGFLLTMTGRAATHEAHLADFDALLDGFRFLDD